MKKILIVSVCFLSIISSSCKHEGIHERIAWQSREFTERSCPKRMDTYTVLDSIVYAKEDKTMSYYYSVSDKLDNDSIYTDVFLNVFHTDLLNNLRDNIGLVELKQNYVRFKYIYYSSTSKKEYMLFCFEPEMYR